MDKDMKAKVDEIMKDLGTRELSMDEMDKVSGGTDILINGNLLSEAEAYNIAMALVDQFAYDVAAEMFCKMTKISTNEIKREYRSGASNKENMTYLFHRCVQIYSKTHGN